MNVYGKKVVLRAIEKEDLEVLYKAINDPNLEKMEESHNFPISLYSQEKWLSSILNNKDNYRFIVEYNNKAIGWASLINIDWINRCAHHGVKIFSEEYMGKGLAKDSIMAVMRYAFDELNLNRLEGSIINYNIKSKELYIKNLKWVIEGIKRQAVYKNGMFHDVIMVSILKNEYNKLIKEIMYWDF